MSRELTAEITVGKNRKILELSGEMDYPRSQEVNWSLSNLGFCETFPIGCHRYYSEREFATEEAEVMLKLLGFTVCVNRRGDNIL